MRQANETLTAKNHELLQLNRDAGRLLELNGRLEQDLRQAREDATGQQQALDGLKLLAAEHTALQTRWADDTHRLDTLRGELTGARDALEQERTHRQQVQAEAARVSARLEATQELLERFSPAAEPQRRKPPRTTAK